MRARPFAFHQGHLHCDAVSLSQLAGEYGTPLYVYSATAIRERYQAFQAAFAGVPHTICYSVKANSNLSILRLLHKLGSGFDVVSGGELQRVLTVSRRANKLAVFSGVGKTPAEMDYALRHNILLFNVESEGELEALAAHANRARTKARIALRVNPDVPAETHPYISTGLREHKFGVAYEEAARLYRMAARSKWLEVAGVSAHIGSQITTPAPFAAAIERLVELTRELLAEGHRIKYLDAGGGLGIPYQPGGEDFAVLLQRYAAAVTAPLTRLKVHLLLEPGRAIVASAGALLTRVLYQKTNGSKRFTVVDAGMNDLLRPSLYQAYHDAVPVFEASAHGPAVEVDLVGPVCESGDFFARDRRLPLLVRGELLALMDTGAYGISLASNYNSRPIPAEVLVDGRKHTLIRRRQTFREMVKTEM